MKAKRVLNGMLVVMMLAACLMAIGCGKSPTEPKKDDDPNPGPPGPQPGPQPTPEQAYIAGTINLGTGVQVDLNNARAAVYSTEENWLNDVWAAKAAVTGSGGSFSFQVGPLQPGTYYCDVWQDLNQNGVIDGDDYFDVYATNDGYLKPIQVNEGQTTTITFSSGSNKAIPAGPAGKWGVWPE